MKYLYLIACFFVPSTLMAQLELHLDGANAPESITLTKSSSSGINADYYFYDSLHIVNTGNQPLQLEYKRIRRYHKHGWYDQICDDFCFPAPDNDIWTRPTDAGNTVIIAPGDSSVFAPKIFPDLISGCSIYAYQITNVFGIVYDTIQVTATLDVESCFLGAENHSGAAEVSVYPNPVKDVLNISVNQTEKAVVTIYNLQGKVVLTTPLNNGTNQLQIDELNAGVYFYSVRDNGDLIDTKKLIIL